MYAAMLAAAVLLGLVVAVVAVGASLPREHVASRSLGLPRPPGEVWAVIRDVDRQPEWRNGLRRVERLPDVDGRPRWKEVGGHDAITFELVEERPPSRMVTRIADPGLPFGGSWTYALEPSPEGCTLTITEHGEVRNPVFRFASRFVLGHTATIDAYLGALGRKLGGDRRPPGS